MAINDPRIVKPGQGPEADAVRAFAAEQSMKNSPMYGEIQHLKEQLQLIVRQNQALTSRYHALMDYFQAIGLFVAQEVDHEGYPQGDTFTPPNSLCIFESLVEQGMIDKMPDYGLEVYLAEHLRLGSMLVQFSQGINRGTATMKEVIETVRSYNNDPRRIVPLRGDHFQLDAYLTANPDDLSEEEMVALADEFGLYKVVEEETDAGLDTPGDSGDAGTEDTPTGPVPVEDTPEGA